MTIVSTTLLVNDNERQLVGLSSAFDQAHPKRGLRFDPEGARVGQTGQIFVSDEYGPSVCEFSSTGKLARRFKIPAKFRPTKLSADPTEENSTNKTGRQANGGFEGLALTPDGKKLFAFTQRPLLQDNQPNAEDPKKRLGIYNRFLEIDAQSGATREFVYPLEHSTHGVSEVLAINDHEFFVLERDGKAGLDAAFKKVFHIDLDGLRHSYPTDTEPDQVLLKQVSQTDRSISLSGLPASGVLFSGPVDRLRDAEADGVVANLVSEPNSVDTAYDGVVVPVLPRTNCMSALLDFAVPSNLAVGQSFLECGHTRGRDLSSVEFEQRQAGELPKCVQSGVVDLLVARQMEMDELRQASRIARVSTQPREVQVASRSSAEPMPRLARRQVARRSVPRAPRPEWIPTRRFLPPRRSMSSFPPRRHCSKSEAERGPYLDWRVIVPV